jgi:LAO/AO transport system kinase
VGIIAVDPSSAVSGGAIFGDRLRMDAVDTDPGVFIRSMATRGNLGGLALRAAEAADILDAAGKEIVIFETVGSGQIELDIMDAADTVVLLSTPGTGDMVQAMKAGIMEAGEIFVVNKADLEGAELAKADIEAVLGMRQETSGDWRPPVVLVNSLAGLGVAEVVAHIDQHRRYLLVDARLNQKRKKWIEKRVRMLVDRELTARFWTLEKRQRLMRQLDPLATEIPSPMDIANNLLSS